MHKQPQAVSMPAYMITPTQHHYMQGRTRKATLQADGKTLRFMRLSFNCKNPVWQYTRYPIHYKCKADAMVAKEAWEMRGEFLNHKLECVL